MSMQIFYQPSIPENHFFLDADESRHCVKVLRKQEGDTITVVDGKGNFYHARITDANPRQCAFSVEERRAEEVKNFQIHIAIAPTKNADRLEWFIEKAVEMGIDEVSLLICENAERKKLKTDRLERKAVSAMKQSLKATLPAIHQPVPFTEFIQQARPEQQKFVAFVSDAPTPHLFHAAPPASQYIVLIGPEGDFTPEEIRLSRQQGYQSVSLGQSRLRTETAGIVACQTLHLLHEKEVRKSADHKT